MGRLHVTGAYVNKIFSLSSIYFCWFLCVKVQDKHSSMILTRNKSSWYSFAIDQIVNCLFPSVTNGFC